MTIYEVLGPTLIRRRRDPEDVVEEKRRPRKLPTIAAEVKDVFRELRQLGRRTGSTR